MPKIMIVEDEPIIRRELTNLLRRYGYDVTAPTDFQTIFQTVHEQQPDLLVLDLQLPCYDGYHICRVIRETSMIPIMVVTSRNSELDEIMSMNLGADDFLTKPYQEQILIARVQALLRRTMHTSKEQEQLSYNGLTLDLKRGSVEYQQQFCELTKNEFKILICLLQQPQTVVSRDE
ncbi:MAG: response regulator transcription factor, partial [Culicoidibacterales bacterium]